MTINAIIVDDESASRETLSNYINKYCPEVCIKDQCDSVNNALESINKYNPDLVFLDIEMPFANGFDLLDRVPQINFSIIFVTAYSQYAIKALNISASYYILKPVDIDDLISAVKKVKEEIEKNEQGKFTKILIDNLKTTASQDHKITLPLIDGFEVIQLKDVIRIQANDNFSDFHLCNGARKVICRTLKHYEDSLLDFEFIRVHKSHLINKLHVKKYIKGKGGRVIMSDNSEIEISQSRKKNFLNQF